MKNRTKKHILSVIIFFASLYAINSRGMNTQNIKISFNNLEALLKHQCYSDVAINAGCQYLNNAIDEWDVTTTILCSSKIYPTLTKAACAAISQKIKDIINIPGKNEQIAATIQIKLMIKELLQNIKKTFVADPENKQQRLPITTNMDKEYACIKQAKQEDKKARNNFVKKMVEKITLHLDNTFTPIKKIKDWSNLSKIILKEMEKSLKIDACTGIIKWESKKIFRRHKYTDIDFSKEYFIAPETFKKRVDENISTIEKELLPNLVKKLCHELYDTSVSREKLEQKLIVCTPTDQEAWDLDIKHTISDLDMLKNDSELNPYGPFSIYEKIAELKNTCRKHITAIQSLDNSWSLFHWGTPTNPKELLKLRKELKADLDRLEALQEMKKEEEEKITILKKSIESTIKEHLKPLLDPEKIYKEYFSRISLNLRNMVSARLKKLQENHENLIKKFNSIKSLKLEYIPREQSSAYKQILEIVMKIHECFGEYQKLWEKYKNNKLRNTTRETIQKLSAMLCKIDDWEEAVDIISAENKLINLMKKLDEPLLFTDLCRAVSVTEFLKNMAEPIDSPLNHKPIIGSAIDLFSKYTWDEICKFSNKKIIPPLAINAKDFLTQSKNLLLDKSQRLEEIKKSTDDFESTVNNITAPLNSVSESILKYTDNSFVKSCLAMPSKVNNLVHGPIDLTKEIANNGKYYVDKTLNQIKKQEKIVAKLPLSCAIKCKQEEQLKAAIVIGVDNIDRALKSNIMEVKKKFLESTKNKPFFTTLLEKTHTTVLGLQKKIKIIDPKTDTISLNKTCAGLFVYEAFKRLDTLQSKLTENMNDLLAKREKIFYELNNLSKKTDNTTGYDRLFAYLVGCENYEYLRTKWYYNLFSCLFGRSEREKRASIRDATSKLICNKEITILNKKILSTTDQRYKLQAIKKNWKNECSQLGLAT